MSKTLKVGATVGSVATIFALAACGSSGSSSGGSGGSGPIKVGLSTQLTGALAEFGTNQKVGFELAVDQANKAGGVEVGGKKRKVELTILDNRSDPSTAAQQARSLILKNGVQALVGPCAPDFVVPQGLIAERQRVPYVATCVPQRAFLGGNKAGWKYSWASFFDEQSQATNMAKAAASAPSNKKIVLFTDTEPDGKTERPLYQEAIKGQGLKLVGDYTFPPGTTDFSSFINKAKRAGAQLVIAQMIPPDAIALVKQMKSLSFKPAALDISKGADIAGWPKVMGPLADGTIMDQEFLPEANESSKYVQAALYPKDKVQPAVAAGASGYSAMQILFAAMKKAGSSDPQKVNKALAGLKISTAQGEVQFGENHVNQTPVIFAITQYQGGKLVYINPSIAGGKLVSPTAGLR
jgi:branched-chain amino acid transport system substrate-binding protein